MKGWKEGGLESAVRPVLDTPYKNTEKLTVLAESKKQQAR
jgi:hypothetical protein